MGFTTVHKQQHWPLNIVLIEPTLDTVGDVLKEGNTSRFRFGKKPIFRQTIYYNFVRPPTYGKKLLWSLSVHLLRKPAAGLCTISQDVPLLIQTTVCGSIFLASLETRPWILSCTVECGTPYILLAPNIVDVPFFTSILGTLGSIFVWALFRWWTY